MKETKNPLIITKYLQGIHENKRNSAFYGGEVVEIELLDKKYYNYDKVLIMANGDVIGSIYDRNHNCICRFRDKSNHGDFFETTYEYIKDDEELEKCSEYKLIVNDDVLNDFFATHKDAKYLVNFDNNNWWEAFYISDDKIDRTFVLEATDIEEAIKEVLDSEEIVVEQKVSQSYEPCDRVEYARDTYDNESIVIIDSAFIIEDEDDWYETGYGIELSKLGFDKYITFGSGFDIYNVLAEAEYDDGDKSAKQYGCTSNLINVPSGMVGIVRYDDIMKYNPDFDLEELLDNCNCFIAGDFVGEVKFYDVGGDGEIISIVGIGTYGEDKKEIKFKIEPMVIE